MIDNLIMSVYQTLEQAQGIFEKRLIDYGAYWRVMRVDSIVKYLFTKAIRIRIMSDRDQKVNTVRDHIENDFLTIINYSVVGIIQNRLENWRPGDAHMSVDEAMDNYLKVISKFNNYFISLDPYYVEEIGKLSTSDMAKLLIQKTERLERFYTENKEESKVLIFGAFLEIIAWASIAHTTYKATQ